MKRIFLITALFFLLNFAKGQSIFGVGSTPTDGAAATNVSDPTVITEPASMLSGDLCVIYATKRVATGAISMSATGGQTWTQVGSTHNSSTATLTGAVFYCTFNGTWSAHPSVSFSSATNNIAVMIVVRPSSSTNTWSVESLEALSSFAASPSSSSSTFTPSHNNNITIFFSSTDDDNTWTPSGSGWINTGLSAQYRNTSGSDASQAFTYKINQTTLSGAATLLESTLGNDPGIKSLYSFYEVAPAAPHSRRITIIQ